MRGMDTNTLSAIIGFAIIGLSIFAGYAFRKKKIKSGKITDRKGRFYGYTHVFSSRASFSAFYNALRQFITEQDKISIQGNGIGSSMTFAGPGWNAQILQTQTSPGMPNQFVFDFTGYQSRNGVPTGGVSMNVLLTAIEKAFLVTDLDATVTRQPKVMKTKNTFF